MRPGAARSKSKRSYYRGTSHTVDDFRPTDPDGRRIEPIHRAMGFQPPSFAEYVGKPSVAEAIGEVERHGFYLARDQRIRCQDCRQVFGQHGKGCPNNR
jgi:hypothetical protein